MGWTCLELCDLMGVREGWGGDWGGLLTHRDSVGIMMPRQGLLAGRAHGKGGEGEPAGSALSVASLGAGRRGEGGATISTPVGPWPFFSPPR